MNIGAVIREIRIKKGMSQGELASAVNLSQTSLSQIENGAKRPHKRSLESICKALEVPETILYLYGLEKEDVPERKKEAYDLLYPAIKDLLHKLIE